MSVFFVAGIGTDVGKTYVTAQLIAQLRAKGRPVEALKPVASGVAPLDHADFGASDTAMLLNALGRRIDQSAVEACTPWRFQAPLSPDMAADAEGRSLLVAEILDWCQRRIEDVGTATTLVEGVGGVMSPIAHDALNLDLISALGAPVILVGATYLGAISHTLTALDVLDRRSIKVKALILNESLGGAVNLDASATTLRRFAPELPIYPLDRDGLLEDLDLRL